MLKQLLTYCQYVLPQHLLTKLMGKLANCKTPWLKNSLIKVFCWRYNVNLAEALNSEPHDYPNFNAFFTRALKPAARHVDASERSIISPADGTISELGSINNKTLLQAKGMYFNLDMLLANQHDVTESFLNGSFATIYLSPKDYHRVHMPFSGTLRKSIFIPGKLFSVNRMTSEIIPNLYARNERLVLIFDTKAGPMAVILVGAMIVGSIKTVWMDQPISSKQLAISRPDQEISLNKGDELGHFEMGSTVILLFNKDFAKLSSTIQPQNSIKFGQKLAELMVS